MPGTSGVGASGGLPSSYEQPIPEEPQHEPAAAGTTAAASVAVLHLTDLSLANALHAVVEHGHDDAKFSPSKTAVP